MLQSFDKWAYAFCVKMIRSWNKIFSKVTFYFQETIQRSCIQLSYIPNYIIWMGNIAWHVVSPAESEDLKTEINLSAEEIRRSSTRAFVFLFHSRNREIVIKRKI